MTRIRAFSKSVFSTLLIAFALPLGAQTPGTSGDAWAAVQTLRVGTPIHIRVQAQKKIVRCTFDSASLENLSCHQRRAGMDVPVSVDRSQTLEIRSRNMLVSAAAGTAIGVGVGYGMGAIVDAGIKDPKTTNDAKFAGGLARAGGLLGGLFGVATEFVPGKLLYRRPSLQK